MDKIQELKLFLGLLDGEGCFHNNEYYPNSSIIITNCDLDIINFCKEIYRRMEIQVIEKRRLTSVNRLAYDLCIKTNDKFRRFYNNIKPFFECRINELQLLLGDRVVIPNITPCLYWLVGIIESEGSIQINRREEKFKKYYKHSISIDNTNERIIWKSCNTLCHYGIRYTSTERTSSYGKLCHRIILETPYRILELLKLCKPYWVSNIKKKQSSLMEEFVRSRMRNYRKPYSDREVEIYHELKETREWQNQIIE